MTETEIVKKDLEDDIFHNNGEKENEESTT